MRVQSGECRNRETRVKRGSGALTGRQGEETP